MKPYYSNYKTTITQTLIWLLPTVVEIAVYALLALITLALSNIDFITEFLLLPPDFSLKTAVLGSVEELLAQLFGQRTAATLITGIFWGVVGMIVYVLIWLFGNFSTELSNDLALSRFMHPRGADTYSPLKGFLFRLIFQFFIGVLVVIYLNLLITVMLPVWATRYNIAVDMWPHAGSIWVILLTLATQVLALHLLTVLFRLLLLRKRIFFSDL